MEHVTVKDLIEGTGGSFLYGDSQMPVRHIVLDSREIGPGDLFVPLKGEKVDSHRFLEDVVKRGAACVLTSEHETLPEYAASYPCAWIRVEDTKAALQAFGRYMRKRLSLPLVGITGSVGKTTTRELIAAALSAKYRVYKTPGNKNSQVGVPITISEISKDDQVGVIELGMSEPGELKVISEIACIDMAVITNIGITHIEYLGSRENIYREKGLSAEDYLQTLYNRLFTGVIAVEDTDIYAQVKAELVSVINEASSDLGILYGETTVSGGIATISRLTRPRANASSTR